jgi:glutamine amidotransferase
MSARNVAIVDSGGANIASLLFALERLGASGELTRDAHTIQRASHVILPGVGAAADAMLRLQEAGLCDVIAGLQQPVLGICLGMQLLGRASEEAATECLGIIPAVAEKLPASTDNPVPNMGWCRVAIPNPHGLFAGIDDGSYFYFLHSYALPPDSFTLATADHHQPFTAVLAQRNFYAAQFHPERSAAAGARFLQNFLGLST